MRDGALNIETVSVRGRARLRRRPDVLVIVPPNDPAPCLQAMKLTTGTDVTLTTAEDLEWLAEDWQKVTDTDILTIEISNRTGLLRRRTLEEPMNRSRYA